MSATKRLLRRHLAERGLLFGASPNALERRLRRAMGAARYADYLEVAEAYREGHAAARDLYAACSSAAEAAIFQSEQAATLLIAGAWLADRVALRAGAGSRITELGCWAGELSSFL